MFLVFRIEPDTSHLIVIRMQGHKRGGKEGKKEKGRKAERQAGRKEGREKEGGREGEMCYYASRAFIHPFSHLSGSSFLRNHPLLFLVQVIQGELIPYLASRVDIWILKMLIINFVCQF